MEPEISVIVPIYQTAGYLERCLESILNQSFHNFEVLCVDDASPDNSSEIVERIAFRDHRVRLLVQETNQGVGAARNRAIEEARGAWIANVDSDDYIDASTLEALYRGTKGQHFDIVACGWNRVDENGAVISRHTPKAQSFDPIPDEADPFAIISPSFCTKLWRRALFVKNGIRFPNGAYYEDSATTPRLVHAANSINVIHGNYYKYFSRTGSATNTTSDKHIIDRLRDADVKKWYFKSLGEFKKYRKNFNKRLYAGFAFHGGNVAKNPNMLPADKDEYLRYLLLLRESYIALDDVLGEMTVAELGRELRSDRPLLSYSVDRAARESPVGLPDAPLRGVPDDPRVAVVCAAHELTARRRDIASLEAQLYSNWELHEEVVPLEDDISALIRIHERLLEDFDCVLHVRAQVVFSDVFVLGDMVREFLRRPETDVYTVRVRDGISGGALPIVHLVSGRAVGGSTVSSYSLPSSLSYPGDHTIDHDFSADRLQWRTGVTDKQAVLHGNHDARLLGLTHLAPQRDQPSLLRERWKGLETTWNSYKLTRSRQQGLFLGGAILMQEQLALQEANGPTPDVDAVLELNHEQLHQMVRAAWVSEGARARFLSTVVDEDVLIRCAVLPHAMGPAGRAAHMPGTIEVTLPESKSFEDLYAQGRDKMEEGSFHEALGLMRRALDLRPGSKIAYGGVAESMVGNGELAGAAQVYEYAVRRHPGDSDLIRRLEVIQGSDGPIDPEVPGHFEEAIRGSGRSRN